MIPALNLLAMGGGQKPIVIDANTLIIRHEDRTLVVQRGVYSMKTVYIDKAAKKRISVDWAKWLPSDVTIASSTWETENETNRLVVSDTSATSTVTECYIDTTDYDFEIFLKNTIVTDATIPETESRSFLIKTVRTF